MATTPKEHECFLISAFGTKPLLRDQNQTIDFDLLQVEIKQAVQAYELSHSNTRLIIKRADEFSGGVITREFYQQLYKADLVIAEISSLNLNVYYELGVRMALKRNATIMMALAGTPLPFDLHEVRVVFYQPGKLLSDKSDELHWLMEARLAGEVDSPVYAAIPDIEILRREEVEKFEEHIRLLQGLTERETYGLKIASPEDGSEVKEWFTVSGTFEKMPPKGAARLINKSPQGFGYWPQCIVNLDPKTKIWNGRCHLGDRPPEEGLITIAVVGKGGSVLWDYYEKVGQETNKWPAIQNLTDDILECDHIRVVKTKKWFSL